MKANFRLLCGDCFTVLPDLVGESVDLVCTSPPYAEQRKRFYTGILEGKYPAWTCAWASLLRHALTPDGNLAIVIRPHLRDGVISDYVLRTRLALREAGWYEAEELIWYKPASPPIGSVYRPRRAWESILWFSKSRRPYCDTRANGKPSDRIGFDSATKKKAIKAGYIHTDGKEITTGTARSMDVISVPISGVDKNCPHPAQYPVDLPRHVIRLLSPKGGTVLDPFMGSGSTGVASLQEDRNFISIEKEAAYYDHARQRIGKERGQR